MSKPLVHIERLSADLAIPDATWTPLFTPWSSILLSDVVVQFGIDVFNSSNQNRTLDVRVILGSDIVEFLDVDIGRSERVLAAIPIEGELQVGEDFNVEVKGGDDNLIAKKETTNYLLMEAIWRPIPGSSG